MSTEYQTVYEDNFDIVGILRTRQLIVTPEIGEGDGSATISGVLTSNSLNTGSIASSGITSSGSVTATGNISTNTGTVSGANLTATNTVSGATVTSTGNISTNTGTVSGANLTATNTVSGATVTATGNISTNTGTVSGANLTATNTVSGATVTATGTVSGATVTSTGNISTNTGTVSGANLTATNTVSGATITATGTISGANVNVSGTTTSVNVTVSNTLKTDKIDPNTSNGTTTISAPKFPVSLGTGVSSGVYVPVTNNNGDVRLLQASASANQVLSTDGSNIIWRTLATTEGGSILSWVALTERYTNGNNATYYTGSAISTNIATTSGSYIRVFTEIVGEPATFGPITLPSSISYTNSTSGLCYHNFTLGSGRYIVLGSFPASMTIGSNNGSYVMHAVDLESVSATPTLFLRGSNEVSTGASRSVINGIITISTNTQLRITHRLTPTISGSTAAFLGQSNTSTTNVYGTLTIIKIA